MFYEPIWSIVRDYIKDQLLFSSASDIPVSIGDSSFEVIWTQLHLWWNFNAIEDLSSRLIVTLVCSVLSFIEIRG